MRSKMKVRVPGLIKRIITALSSKTNDLRTRFMIFFLLHRDQTLLLDKLQAVVAGRHGHRNAARNSLHDSNKDYADNEEEDGDVPHGRGSFVVHMNMEPAVEPTSKQAFSYTQEIPEDSCIDLTNTLFKESEEEMELNDKEDGTPEACKDGRGIESMNAVLTILEDEYGRMDEEAGEEDIDHAADLFIERFRRQIRLQKQLSLQERHCSSAGMLQQNV